MKISDMPARKYNGSIKDRQFLSKAETLRYAKELFYKEVDRIDKKYM